MNAIARRLPAITVLTIAAILAILTSGVLVRMIEARSLADVVRVLRISGFDWARVTVDGLQVRLSGSAQSEALRFRALTAAGTVVDPARVIDEIAVVEAKVAAPRFSVEILRTGNEISLIGLLPAAMDRSAFLQRIEAIVPDGEVADLLDSASHPVPAGWDRAVAYGLDALQTLERAKISIAADRVRINGNSDSANDQRRLETELARKVPEGLQVAIEITAPRPAIAPFILRFVMDGERIRFDACSADTPEAQQAIIRAAVAAGMTGKIACTIGLGSPSPRWAEAAVLAIGAVHDLGGGSVTLSDADVSLIAPEGTPKAQFDTVVGTLENALPDAFTLTAVLPEKAVVAGPGASDGPPDFVAELAETGVLQMRGKVRDARERAVIDGFARALFGAANVRNATRLDPAVPEGWPVRVLAALESLDAMVSGSVLVQPDYVEVGGTTGNPEAQSDLSRLLSSRLGEGAKFELKVVYDKKLDPVLGLPTPEECASEINAAIAAKKISFAPGSVEIEAGAASTLDRIAGLMKNCSDYAMEVGGHTDSQGREEMNQQLSQSRAEAVLDALLARRVLVANLTARGYGETLPVADNGTEEGREANRRIEFRLIAGDEDGGAQDGADAGAADGAGDGAAESGDGGQ